MAVPPDATPLPVAAGPRPPEAVLRLIDGSLDPAVLLDADHRVHHHNAAWRALTGLRPRALKRALDDGARCHQLLPLAVCSEGCVMALARACGRSTRVDEVAARRTEGEEATLIVTATPVDDRWVVESYRDVTAEARVQRKYQALLERERQDRAALARAVEERTRELGAAQEQLIVHEKMSSLGRLVAGIAHELNNPINFVHGNVGFLDEYFQSLLGLVYLYEAAPLPDEVRAAAAAYKRDSDHDFLIQDWARLLRSIRAGAERTAQIVTDLKTYSQPQVGAVGECDLTAGIELTLHLLQSVLAGITVERDLSPALTIECRGGQVQQVMMNLLGNAAHAAGPGGWIRVSAHPDGDGARLTVRDSGPGVPEPLRAQIFDPFFTTKQPGQGTGLGLAISAQIVRAHGGRIDLTSPPGQGAEFSVWLPAKPR